MLSANCSISHDKLVIEDLRMSSNWHLPECKHQSPEKLPQEVLQECHKNKLGRQCESGCHPHQTILSVCSRKGVSANSPLCRLNAPHTWDIELLVGGLTRTKQPARIMYLLVENLALMKAVPNASPSKPCRTRQSLDTGMPSRLLASPNNLLPFQ